MMNPFHMEFLVVGINFEQRGLYRSILIMNMGAYPHGSFGNVEIHIPSCKYW